MLSKKELEEKGYTFEVSPKQYLVKHHGTAVSAGSCEQPIKHWKHSRKAYNDNMALAMQCAMKHLEGDKEPVYWKFDKPMPL